MTVSGGDLALSVLDLCPVISGSDAAETFERSVDLARFVEELGYRRYWVAEHHSMPGIGSAATSVIIGHLAGSTSSIRVGAGGIMLLNHVSARHCGAVWDPGVPVSGAD